MRIDEILNRVADDMAAKDREEAKYHWRFPGGFPRATKRCVNANKFFPGHLLSSDGKKCFACGAERFLKGNVPQCK